MGLDAIMAIGGLIAPPVFDFIKKKFIKSESDTPERTMGTLATTNPDALPGYVEGLAKLFGAKVQWFNRDVSGTPSQWVIDLRACIRPVTVIGCLIMMALAWQGYLNPEPSARYFAEVAITSWMGSRLVQN